MKANAEYPTLAEGSQAPSSSRYKPFVRYRQNERIHGNTDWAKWETDDGWGSGWGDINTDWNSQWGENNGGWGNERVDDTPARWDQVGHIQSSPPSGTPDQDLLQQETLHGSRIWPVVVSTETDYAPLLNQSPHPVLYRDQLYPTALHLLEAMVHLPHSEALAGRLRAAGTIAQLQSLAWHLDWQDGTQPTPDRSHAVMLNALNEVLRNKFLQHPELRELLMSTGRRPIVYHGDARDGYWGQCLVESSEDRVLPMFGRALEDIRDQLRREGFQ